MTQHIVELENPINLNWATDVVTKLGSISLQSNSDLSISRVTVNVTTFLRLHHYWEQDRKSSSFLPEQAALSHYGLLRGVAGGLIEDLEKLVDDVIYWQRPSRKSREPKTLAEKVKSTFNTPRVKTILAQLQYVGATINLIVEVWKYGSDQDNTSASTEDDRQHFGRKRRLIRSLIMNREVALKYVDQRLAEEDAALLNTTRTTTGGSDSNKTPRSTVLLQRRSIHAEQLDYLNKACNFSDDSRESLQGQNQVVYDLVKRWCRPRHPSMGYSHHEPVFDQESDEEAATEGYGGLGSSFREFRSLPGRDAKIQQASTQPATSPPAARNAPQFARQRTSSGLAGGLPPLSVNTKILGSRPIPPQSSHPTSGRPPSTAVQFNASTDSPRSAPSFSFQHPRAFSMSNAEEGRASLPQQTTKTSRDSGYITEPVVTGTVIEDSDEEDVKIYWQIVIGRKVFPYENSRLTENSDLNEAEVSQYITSHDNAVTEIPTSTVSEAAMRRKITCRFERIPARGRFCEMWRIQSALKFNPDIRDLVQLSNVILKDKQSAERVRLAQQSGSVAVPPSPQRRTIPTCVPPPPPPTTQASQYRPPPTSSQQSQRNSKTVSWGDDARRTSGEASRPFQYPPPPPTQPPYQQAQQPPQGHYPQQQWTQQQYQPQQFQQPPQRQYGTPPVANLQRTTSGPPAGSGYGYGTPANAIPPYNPQAQGLPRNTAYQPPPSSRDARRRKSRPGRASSPEDSYSSDDSAPPARNESRHSSHGRRSSRERRKQDDNTSRRIRNLERNSRQAKEREEGRERNKMMKKAAAYTSGIIAGGAALLEGMDGAL